MAQINQGFSYTTSGANSYVTASNLNQHVSLAQLAGGAVVEQTPNAASNDTDKIIIGTGTGGSAAIWSQTKLQFLNSISSNTISVNTLSVDSADFDSISINGTYGPTNYFNIGNAALYNSTDDGFVMFGYDNITHPLPVGHVGNTFRFHGREVLFTDPTSAVDLLTPATGIDVTIAGSLAVQHSLDVAGGLRNAGKQVVTEIVAAKTGVTAVFGAGILHKTQDFDIPADETWILTFHANWETNESGNTRPGYSYYVRAFAEKATYSDVQLGEWLTVYPPYSGVNRIHAVLILTQASLASLSKKIKFVAYDTNSSSVLATIINASTRSYYNITLQKTKTATFTTDSSIL
jgi:hypothetical protein